MEWNGVPVLVCSGSPRQLGLDHGTQGRIRVAAGIEAYKKIFADSCSINWAEARERAQGFVPALKRLVPDLLEEMQGIADGAEVELLDIVALNVRSEIALTNYSDGCTSISKADETTNSVFLAQNWDWVGVAMTSTAIFDFKSSNKPRIQMQGEAGVVGKYGLNEYGLGVCLNAIRSGALNKDSLPVHVALRRALECKTFEEARDMLIAYGTASCCNIMIADQKGSIATIECSPRGHTVIYPEPGSGSVYHTNHFYGPNIPKEIKLHPAENSFVRLKRIRELGLGKKGSVDAIHSWLSDESGYPMAICREVLTGTVGMKRIETLATIIMDLKIPEAYLSFGRPSLNPPIRVMSFK